MNSMLVSVSEHLLGPGGLTIEHLPAVLADLAGPGIDAADLYFQSQVSETWALEDGIVKEGSFNLDQGVGVRAQSGEKTGFAYSNAITADALSQAARAARWSNRCMPRTTRWMCWGGRKRSSCSSASTLPHAPLTPASSRSRSAWPECGIAFWWRRMTAAWARTSARWCASMSA